ncbi:uncharacterized protein LOC8275521 [Ricinus communis]|nr:uncharacterized protein LOC8275521 [Ricinus communis]|eukprot:XP_015574563.1 uncharacterized protein LOC8275521 [Ricinus communis]
MGICSSNVLNPSSSSPSLAAVLILENGQLEEFSYPVTVSQILKRNPSCFVCKADDMNYDDFILGIDDDEELQLHQLYFALPVSWLSSRLKPQQMAALAVKASLALETAGISSSGLY